MAGLKEDAILMMVMTTLQNCDIDFGFYFLRQGRTSSEDGSEAAGEHTVTFHYHHSFIAMNYKNLN